MIPRGRPLFEVVVAATADERRLVSADTIRALAGFPDTVTDATINLLIDAELARCARSCRLATARATSPTLAQETVRATWRADLWDGYVPSRHPYGAPSTLLLPWRAPITSIEVAEGETALVEDTDFRLLGAGVVERIDACWATSGEIVVDYVAGFVPLAADPAYQAEGEPLPADLVAMIADQVRMSHGRMGIDPNLRSEDIPGVWSGSYNIPGGDAIDTSGLMRPLYDALAPYRAPPSIG